MTTCTLGMHLNQKKNTWIILNHISIQQEVRKFPAAIGGSIRHITLLLFYVQGKHLMSCRDGQLPNHTFPGQA